MELFQTNGTIRQRLVFHSTPQQRAAINSCSTIRVRRQVSNTSHPRGETFLPNPMSVPVTHIISDTSEASERAAVGTFPYLIWNGSIMVTYLLFLIGSAKNRPPQWWRRKRERFQFIAWMQHGYLSERLARQSGLEGRRNKGTACDYLQCFLHQLITLFC